MGDSFVSRKDRIVASAIEIISDLGLSALTTKNLAQRENMSEALLYKYFSGIDEVLTEVVDFYSRYDEQIRHTVSAKECTYIEKITEYVDTYATYYDSYYAMSTLMLHYEELLHNVWTREKVSELLIARRSFVVCLFDGAIQNGEINDMFSVDELADTLHGIMVVKTLNRRYLSQKHSYKKALELNLKKWLDFIRTDKQEG